MRERNLFLFESVLLGSRVEDVAEALGLNYTNAKRIYGVTRKMILISGFIPLRTVYAIVSKKSVINDRKYKRIYVEAIARCRIGL